METPDFPHEEGFRQFVRSLGRRYRNPYGDDPSAYTGFAAGWRHAALLCGQPQLAGLTDTGAGTGQAGAPGLMPPPSERASARRPGI